MSDSMGVGVVGVGGVAVGRHLPALAEAAREGRAHTAVLFDLDRARARALASQWHVSAVAESYQAVLDRPDVAAVIISTPNVAHYAQVMAALAAGKHVLCEKPLAMTVAEARSMTEAATGAGLVTGINFRYRWIPAARFVTDLVNQGALGRIYHGVFHYFVNWLADPATPGAWRNQRAVAGSGALGDLGSHAIDLAGTWLGEAASVQGSLMTFNRERPDQAGQTLVVDVDDAAAFTIDYAGGAVGHFVVSRCAPGRRNFQRVELYGSNGAVSYEIDRYDQGGEVVQVCLGTPQSRLGGFAPVRVSPQHLKGAPSGPIHEFIDAIRQGRPAVPAFVDGLRAQVIMAAIEESAASGRRVDVAPV